STNARNARVSAHSSSDRQYFEPDAQARDAGGSAAPNPRSRVGLNGGVSINSSGIMPSSAVARRTVDQALNLVLVHQLPASLPLVRRLLPIDAKNLVAVANELLRLPVALQAPLHEQRPVLPHERHVVHRPV